MKHNVEVMISEAEVAARIAKLGEEITARYQGSDEVVMIDRKSTRLNSSHR